MKIFILVFCLILGLISFYFAIKMLRLYSRVKKWARVNARITSKKVSPKRLSNASRGAAFRMDVNYEYTYNGIKYTGDKIFLVDLLNGERGFTQKGAQKELDKLPIEIEIYCNPENPERSVMNADGLGIYIFMVVFGFFAPLVGLMQYVSDK